MTDDLPTLSETLPGRYRHDKGGEYEVLGATRRSETLEPLVIYLVATDRATTRQRQQAQQDPLLRHCRPETWALMRLWSFLVERPAVTNPP